MMGTLQIRERRKKKLTASITNADNYCYKNKENKTRKILKEKPFFLADRLRIGG